MTNFLKSKRFFNIATILLLFVGVFAFEFCKKENTFKESSLSPEMSMVALDRDGEVEEEYQYFFDESEVSLTTFQNLDSNFYSHFVIDVKNNKLHHECRIFSTRSKYETWGDALGYKVSNMNRVEDRLSFLADSAGLTSVPEASITVVPTWYINYQNALMEKEGLIPPSASPAGICFTGGRLNQAMCNPTLPVGMPWSCGGVSDVFTIFYLPGGTPWLSPLMNNKASSWLPSKAFLCSAESQASMRGWKNMFYIKKIGTITVNLQSLGNLPTGLFVPFRNIYSKFDNVMGSFTHWGHN